MVLIGHVRNGQIVPDTQCVLPEGACVRIEISENHLPHSVYSNTAPGSRQGGQYANQIWMADDFDEWPADMQSLLGMTP